MDIRTDQSWPGVSQDKGTSVPSRGRVPLSWVLAGLCLLLATAVVVLEFHHVSRAAVVMADESSDGWWYSPTLLAFLVGAMVLCAAIMVTTHQRRLAQMGRDAGREQLHDIAHALATLNQDPRSAWRTLREERVIDGHALWDADDRLVDFSGFLGRYIPHLADWRSPSARQTITAMVDSGQMALLPGLSREQTLDAYCEMRRQVPGLRELRMTDGHIYTARNVDLGQGRLATIFSNVTDLQRPRSGLAGSDAFRQAFDQAPSAKLLVGRDGRPRAANRAFTQLFGHTALGAAAMGWRGLLHPDESADLPPWSVGLYRMITADGQDRRIAVTTQHLVDDLSGDFGDRLITLEDVSARLDSEERRRVEAAVLEHVGLPILAVDRGGRVAFGNLAARHLFQWGDSVLPGTPVERLLGAALRNALGDGGSDLETEGTTWDGTTFPAHVGMARLDESSPLPGGTVLAVTDQTPRRALDLQMMHSARLATLGEMAASIAHEFNQCLHVIRLASEAVQMDIGDGLMDAGRLSKRADNILSQVDRLTEMVTHMRTISRREGQDKKPFSPQAAVDSALRMVEPMLRVDGIRVVRRGDLNGLRVLGHQVRLEQVLLNLLNNGRDAIRDRFRRDGNTGGTITVTCTQCADSPRLRIAVRDDGTGIATAVGDHIFDPFVTTKEGGKGLGLGLSISRGICTEMGGCLGFENVEGGAEFTIDLPLATDCGPFPLCAPAAVPLSPQTPCTAAEHGGGEDSDDEQTGRRRVLLVDDEALSVLMVAEFLSRQGYRVDTAYDGLEAYELCQTHVYDTVITDVRMPRMTGRELIAKLADLQPGTPVIVVTGHLKESNAADLGDNVVALLAKPFQLQDLREQLLRLETNTQEREELGG